MSTVGGPTPLRTKRADAQRNVERLLAAARETFGEDGVDASLNEVARRAGVGPGTLYRHFPTREALLQAVFADELLALYARAEGLLDAPSALDAVSDWLRAFAVSARTYRGTGASVVLALGQSQTPTSVSCDEAMRAAAAMLLARAEQAGEIRAGVDVDDLLTLVAGAAWATERSPIADARFDRMLALIVDALRPQR